VKRYRYKILYRHDDSIWVDSEDKVEYINGTTDTINQFGAVGWCVKHWFPRNGSRYEFIVLEREED